MFPSPLTGIEPATFCSKQSNLSASTSQLGLPIELSTKHDGKGFTKQSRGEYDRY